MKTRYDKCVEITIDHHPEFEKAIIGQTYSKLWKKSDNPDGFVLI